MFALILPHGIKVRCVNETSYFPYHLVFGPRWEIIPLRWSCYFSLAHIPESPQVKGQIDDCDVGKPGILKLSLILLLAYRRWCKGFLIFSKLSF